MAGRGACRRCVPPACLVAAIAALVMAGLYVPGVIDERLHRGVRDYVVMAPQAAKDYYGRFVNNTGEEAMPSYLRFWMFNITNLEEVRQGAKPNLTEIGPYTYRAYYSNFDVRFNWVGMMSYKGFTSYKFEPSLSPGLAQNDTLVTLNLPFLGALLEMKARYKHFKRLMKKRMSHLIERWGQGEKMGLFMKREVDELLWGYQDPLVKRLEEYADVNPDFALMHNGSHSAATQNGQTVVNTGAGNLTLLGNIEMLRGISSVSSWNNHTEVVRGTDGTRFHPWVKDNETMTMWVDELFRAVRLSPVAAVNMDGMKLLRYKLDPSMAEPDPRFFQYVEGLFNATSPMAGGANGPPDEVGLPVYFSLPHYCHAAANLTNGVNGLACNLTQHELYIDVEPVTGQVWSAAKRFMMSSEFGPEFKRIDANLTRTILPVFWVEEASQASAFQAEALNDGVFKVQKAMGLSGSLPFLMAALLASSLLCVVFGMFLARKPRRTSALMWDSFARTEQVMPMDAGDDAVEPLLGRGQATADHCPTTSPTAGPSGGGDSPLDVQSEEPPFDPSLQ